MLYRIWTLKDWTQIGQKVGIILASDEYVVGWLIDATVTTLTIAQDRDAKILRLIRQSDVDSLEFGKRGENAIAPPIGLNRLGRLAEADAVLTRHIEPLVGGIDTAQLRDVAIALRRLRRPDSDEDDLEGFGQEHVFDPRSTYKALDAGEYLVDELQRNGVLQVLAEDAKLIQLVLHEETLPLVDADVVSLNRLREMMKAASEADGVLTDVKDAISQAKDAVWSRKDTARVVDGVGDVVLGGSLASLNIAAAVLVGLIGSLPTLGIGSVTAALAVGTSGYTGLANLKKGAVSLIRGRDTE